MYFCFWPFALIFFIYFSHPPVEVSIMKLDELYTDKQLIFNSPLSDICKAKPVGSSQGYVCLKIVDVDFKIPPHSIHREIKSIKRLQLGKHAGIVKYFDDFQIFDDMILVEEYYPKNLSQLLLLLPKYLRTRTRYNFAFPEQPPKYTVTNVAPASEIRLFLRNVASALLFIHEHEIIHRDIKPSNIMFRMGDDLTQPVLIDFGICYDYTDPPMDETRDEKYVDVSTGIYKLPELILGMTDYSYAIDVWLLGVVMTVLYSNDFKSVLIKSDASSFKSEGNGGGNGRHVDNLREEEENKEEEEDEEEEQMSNEMAISDLHLLSCQFKCFGTPHYGCEEERKEEEERVGERRLVEMKQEDGQDDELLWKELEKEEYHYRKFNLKRFKRKCVNELLPLCDDEEVQSLWLRMIRYDRCKRITSKELYNALK